MTVKVTPDMKKRIFTAVAVLGLALTGCSPGPDASGPEANLREGGGQPVPGADEEMDELFQLPVHAYQFTAVEENTLRNGKQVLVEECMRNLGFNFTRDEPREIDPVGVAAFGPQNNYLGRWHVDAEYAAEHGFSHPEELLDAEEQSEVPSKDPRIDHEGATYEDALAALTGFPEGAQTPSGDSVPEWGCEGWSEAELDEGVNLIGVEEAKEGGSAVPLGINPIATDIANRSYEEAENDQRLLDAESAWVECMAESGYADEYPDTIGSGKETAVDSDDTEAAVRNVECREESSLTDTYVEVLTEIQGREIEENEAALQERAEQMERALERAGEILAD
jgi:hypothetical protein